jgi:large subunit ribosomal protein L13
MIHIIEISIFLNKILGFNQVVRLACFSGILYNARALVLSIYSIGLLMKTYFATKENIEHKWYVVDASGKVLGRLASQIAKYLRGKHKPEYTPHADAGDYVVVLNASQVKVTGNKEKEKVYYRHSGYPGGIKETTLEKLRAKNPNQVIEKAVKGMLPKNPLGRAMLRKLKVYAGSEHPHQAQDPKNMNFEKEKQD